MIDVIVKQKIPQIGNTPLQRIRGLYTGNLEVYAKREDLNFSGSVKIRAVDAMLRQKSEEMDIRGKDCYEPTSGNTGIAIAALAKLYGFHPVLAVPEAVPASKIEIMKSQGAEVYRCPDGSCPTYVHMGNDNGAYAFVQRALESPRLQGKVFTLDQYNNPYNIEGQKDLAREILLQTGGKVDVIFAAVGTLGTLCALSNVLKEYVPHVKVYGVDVSPNTKYFGMKSMEDAMKFKLYRYLNIDGLWTISDKDIGLIRAMQLDLVEGIPAGPTSGVVFEALRRFAEPGKRGTAVFIVADGKDRYQDLFETFRDITPGLEGKLAQWVL